MSRLLDEKNYEHLMRTVVEPGLEAMREEIDLPLDGGGTLHAEVYNRYDAKGAVVIVHGYTESAEKFRELAWYLLQEGYSVFAADHRGHGRSVRALEDTSVTHVDDFDDYLRDLEQFMDRVVKPRMGGAPLYLYAHSMGGAVGGLALMEHPDWFERAVLNAPMVAAVTKPLPGFLAEVMAKAFCAAGKGKTRAFVGKPFDPANEPFETSHATSRARYDYYESKRIAHPYLQNCSPTYQWLREALGVTKRLYAGAEKIKTPVLLCQAGLDSIVKLPPQDKFVSLTPGAKLVRFEGKHELYCAHNELLEGYIDTVLRFYRGEEV